MTVRQILEEAKRLEPIQRAELLEQLFSTFEAVDPSIDAAWAVEAEERLGAYRAGEIEAAPFDEVLVTFHNLCQGVGFERGDRVQ